MFDEESNQEFHSQERKLGTRVKENQNGGKNPETNSKKSQTNEYDWDEEDSIRRPPGQPSEEEGGVQLEVPRNLVLLERRRGRGGGGERR
jgi:hypothetical protein